MLFFLHPLTQPNNLPLYLHNSNQIRGRALFKLGFKRSNSLSQGSGHEIVVHC